MEDIIKQFIKDTPIWHDSFPKEFQNKDCIACGVRPRFLLDVSKALAEERLSMINKVKATAEKMKVEESRGWDMFFNRDSCCPGDDYSDIYNLALDDLIDKLINTNKINMFKLFN